MSIEGAAVEYKCFSGLHICGSILIPNVAMDKARFDASPITLKRA